MKKITKILLTVIAVLIVAGLGLGYHFYKMVYGVNIRADDGNPYLFIYTGSDAGAVFDTLETRGILLNRKSLEWVADKKNYQGKNVVPGKYRLGKTMSNAELINILRAGRGAEQVKVTFNNVKTKEMLASALSRNVEADSISVLQLLNDPSVAQKYGFKESEFISMFIPETYYFYWNTSADSLISRMAREYKSFWTDERKDKASKLGLRQSEVSTLASLVQAEQMVHPDERPRVAGLYLNRLRKNMLLQSDPTVIYAIGDFSINRVLTKHLSYPSPYNTYLHAGLPPGPILIPEKSSIDAVLNSEKHNYIYMCAKEDFSGYHSFATTYSQHLINARKYQQALNRRGIMK